MRLNALCRRLPAPSENYNRYEEAFPHRSDYCCARVCRACFGTAHKSGPECKYWQRPGCYSSGGVRSIFAALQSEREVSWSAQCGPLRGAPHVGGAGD